MEWRYRNGVISEITCLLFCIELSKGDDARMMLDTAAEVWRPRVGCSWESPRRTVNQLKGSGFDE